MYNPNNSVGGILSSLGAPAVPVCRLLMNGPPACRSDPSFVGLLGIPLNIRDLEHIGLRFIYLFLYLSPV